MMVVSLILMDVGSLMCGLRKFLRLIVENSNCLFVLFVCRNVLLLLGVVSVIYFVKLLSFWLVC